MTNLIPGGFIPWGSIEGLAAQRINFLHEAGIEELPGFPRPCLHDADMFGADHRMEIDPGGVSFAESLIQALLGEAFPSPSAFNPGR